MRFGREEELVGMKLVPAMIARSVERERHAWITHFVSSDKKIFVLTGEVGSNLKHKLHHVDHDANLINVNPILCMATCESGAVAVKLGINGFVSQHTWDTCRWKAAVDSIMNSA